MGIKIENSFIRSLIEKYGSDKQKTVCIEELSELQKEICKDLRGKGDIEHITEELADVLIICSELAHIYKIDEENLNKWIEYKINRTKKMLENGI